LLREWIVADWHPAVFEAACLPDEGVYFVVQGCPFGDRDAVFIPITKPDLDVHPSIIAFRQSFRQPLLVDEIDADTDAAEGLPETDVETEFHSRLLLMKRMGQFDDDGPILDHFGLAFVAAQEGGEVRFKPRFAQPQTDH
jgi:hypothetical protein